MALGIDTSRSVASIPTAVKNDEEFQIDKSQLDKRCSVDIAAKVIFNLLLLDLYLNLRTKMI